MKREFSSGGAYIPSKEELFQFNQKNHLIHAKQLNAVALSNIFALTTKIKKGEYDDSLLRGKIAAVLFYEPSTRTRFSFESALARFSGTAITTENAAQFSSASKGETIEDTMRMMNIYSDLVILRTSEDIHPYQASKILTQPFLNAGSGKTQHPTQGILDMFTIYEKFGKFDGLQIAIAGDLYRGRTVDSLVYLLSKFKDITLHFVSADNACIKDSLREHIESKGLTYTETNNLADVIDVCDVLYMTRVQKERFVSEEEYIRARGKVTLDLQLANRMKDDAIIMHPLPRAGEIHTDVDTLAKACYFKQSENGLYIRMALLQIIFTNGLSYYFDTLR